MVTSRSGRRWVLPKGHQEPGQTRGETALHEAWEEAGLTGTLESEPIGAYFYEKLGNRYHVTVFVMPVTEAARDWPERGERERRWFDIEDAVSQIEEPGLRKLLRQALEMHLTVLSDT
jgi:8-oxo-dGTP pyrophosphatase MutT (NUDIX family)